MGGTVSGLDSEGFRGKMHRQKRKKGEKKGFKKKKNFPGQRGTRPRHKAHVDALGCWILRTSKTERPVARKQVLVKEGQDTMGKWAEHRCSNSMQSSSRPLPSPPIGRPKKIHADAVWRILES